MCYDKWWCDPIKIRVACSKILCFSIYSFISHVLCAFAKPFFFSFKPVSPFWAFLLGVFILNAKKWTICSFAFGKFVGNCKSYIYQHILVNILFVIEKFLFCEIKHWNKTKQKGECRFKSLFENLFRWICKKTDLLCTYVRFFGNTLRFFPWIKVIT